MKNIFNNLKLFTILLAISIPEILPNSLIAIIKCLLFIWIVFIETKEIYKVRKDKNNYNTWMILASLFIVCFYELVTNVLHNGELRWTMLLGTSIIFIFYFDYLRLTNNLSLVKYFTQVCNIWVIISFIDVVIIKSKNPQIHYFNDLLLCGYSNGLGAYMPPVIVLNLFFLKENKKNILLIIGSLLAIGQLIIIFPTTAIISLVLILFYFVLSRYKWFKRIASPILILIISLLVFLIFPIFDIYQNPVTEYIIVNILHKNINLTQRTDIWLKAKTLIQESLIFGHGSQSLIQAKIFGVANCHNYYLDILYRSGIVGFVLYLLNYLNDIIFIKKNKDENSRFLLGIYFLMLIPWQFESYCNYYGYPLFYVVLLLSLCTQELQKDKK